MIEHIKNGSPRFITAMALSALMFFAGGFQAALAQDNQVGVAAAVRGGVEVRSGGSVRVPSGGDAMLLGDRVRTQVQSGMQVLLLDESVFTIGQSNDLIIDRFVYDPNQSLGEIAARSSQGFLRFVSGGVGAIAPQNITLETPSATIGTRGTSIDVVVGAEAIELARAAGLIPPGTVVDPATAVFVVLRGPDTNYAGITQRGRVIIETEGGSVEIRTPGFGVFVPRSGASPLGPAAVPSSVNTAITNAIELPGVGLTTTLNGVDLTELPSLGGPNGELPNLENPNPDAGRARFDPGPPTDPVTTNGTGSGTGGCTSASVSC